jgi:hypothetical protein
MLTPGLGALPSKRDDPATLEAFAMNVECYRVKVPEHSRLGGFTAAGQWVPVLAGEHLVHRVKPKVLLRGISEALRFVGADKCGRDVHVAVPPGKAIEAVLGDLAPSAL